MPSGVYKRTKECNRINSESKKGIRKGKKLGLHPKEWNENISKGNKRKWQEFEYRKKQEEANKRPDVRKRISEGTRRGCADPRVRKKRSEITKEMWQRPEYRNKMLEVLSRDECKNDAYGKLGKYKNIMMRSNLERGLAELLDNNGNGEVIRWKYERPRISMENGHTYIPDFSVKKANLIIEAKPKRFVYDEETQYKKEQTIKQGWNFWFYTGENPKKTIKHILKLLVT